MMRSDTSKRELDRTSNEEEQGRILCYSIGLEARGEEETWLIKSNVDEDG